MKWYAVMCLGMAVLVAIIEGISGGLDGLALP